MLTMVVMVMEVVLMVWTCHIDSIRIIKYIENHVMIMVFLRALRVIIHSYIYYALYRANNGEGEM